MQTVIDFLKTNSTGFLATVEEGEPRVRPFQFMLELDGRLWFCTNNTKEVYRQLVSNPHVEFSSASPEFAWVRLSGEAEFTGDPVIKSKVLESHELVKMIYQDAANPIFEVFSLKNGKATLDDFSDNPPKVVAL